jgi:hypothetical protein
MRPDPRHIAQIGSINSPGCGGPHSHRRGRPEAPLQRHGAITFSTSASRASMAPDRWWMCPRCTAAGRRGARAPGYHDLHGHREDVKSVEVQPNPEGRQVQYSRDSRRPIAAPYPGHSLPSPRSSSTPPTVENIGAGDRFSLRPDPPDSLTWPLSPHIFDRGHHCLPVSRGSSF